MKQQHWDECCRKQNLIAAAELGMKQFLEKHFPVGTRVGCWIMYGQINPSYGEVIAHTGGKYAYLRVRLKSRTNNVRDIPIEKIVGALP